MEVRRCRVLAEARHALVSPHLAPHWGGNQTARVMFEPELETLPTGRLRALQVERLRALVARVKVSRPSGVGDRRSADSTSAPLLARARRCRSSSSSASLSGPPFRARNFCPSSSKLTGHHGPLWPGPRRAVAGDIEDLRVREHRRVQVGRVFPFGVEPQAWSDLVHGSSSLLVAASVSRSHREKLIGRLVGRSPEDGRAAAVRLGGKGNRGRSEARACNAPPDLRESLRQVLWALGFAGLGVSGHVLLSRLRR